ncbi:MAG: lipid-A-disaccharide synthase [Thermodesulfobacteriota bacterium]
MAGNSKKLLIVTGEASGDLHGSNLVKAILEIDPSVKTYGVGGKMMAAAGFEPIFDSSELAVVGITEVIGRFNSIRKAYGLLKKTLIHDPPDLVILIDYPDFNLHFAKKVKDRGIPIIYYISPQIWAWRYGRIKKIAAMIDKMIVVFPFEVPLYDRKGVDVEFLGHPILDHIDTTLTRDRARFTLGLKPTDVIVGLLPGSRSKEIKYLLPTMLESARLIMEVFQHAQFLLPMADTIDPSQVYGMIEELGIPVKIIRGTFYEALKSCDAAIIASGTATLEGAILGVPMVVIYKVSPLTYLLGKRFININNIALANIVAEEEVIPEFVQGDVKPERIACEVINYLADEQLREKVATGLFKIKRKLGDPGASKKLARIVYETLS